nr:MAG TPA_asm: hypothetical protein [Caudoviricetes sp.]
MYCVLAVEWCSVWRVNLNCSSLSPQYKNFISTPWHQYKPIIYLPFRELIRPFSSDTLLLFLNFPLTRKLFNVLRYNYF